jgi:hypothetical protein
MSRETSIVVQHKNCLCTYLSDWMMLIKTIKPQGFEHYDLTRVPTTFESLSNNTYDLSVVLGHLDLRLRVLEEESISQLDFLAYAEARVFLKAFFVFFRILLDNVSGVIEFLYNINQRGEAVTRRFSNLLNNAKKGKLPDDLRKLIEQTDSWFPELTATRDDLVHFYDSLLISIERVDGGKNILGHFNTKGHAFRGHMNIRAHLGILLSQYQTLIDNLLAHFDDKFRDWHKIQRTESLRNITIMQGYTALPIWWAYKYGGYKHKDLQISEGG